MTREELKSYTRGLFCADLQPVPGSRSRDNHTLSELPTSRVASTAMDPGGGTSRSPMEIDDEYLLGEGGVGAEAGERPDCHRKPLTTADERALEEGAETFIQRRSGMTIPAEKLTTIIGALAKPPVPTVKA